jgi:hypothetical protein
MLSKEKIEVSQLGLDILSAKLRIDKLIDDRCKRYHYVFYHRIWDLHFRLNSQINHFHYELKRKQS